MWNSSTVETVTCVACGRTVPREDAREYDKHGDRWNREGKSFEYFCKPCDRDRCHQRRRELERQLIECGAGECSREVFLSRWAQLVENRDRERRGDAR